MENNLERICSLIEYGYSICPKNWGEFDAHPSFYKLYFPFGGEGYFEVDDIKKQFSNDKIYILPFSKKIKLSQNNDNPFRVMWFCISLNEIIINDIVEVELKEPYEHIKMLLKYFVFENLDINQVVLLVDIFISLLEQSEYIKKVSNSGLNRVVAYIHENYMNNITNQNLAKIADFEEKYLIRIFKRNYGLTPHLYLLNYRLFKACTFMASGHSVSEVSEMVGFSYPKVFSRAFKKNKGISPAMYKSYCKEMKIVMNKKILLSEIK